MPDTALISAGAGFAAGVAITLALVIARRIARASRELGSDADRAAYTTLHIAGLAAQALRGGRRSTGSVRAARHLRTLLGAEAVAIVVGEEAHVSSASAERETEAGAALEAEALRFARRVEQSGRRQVSARTGVEGLEAVGAPIAIEGEPWGTLIAFDRSVRAPLVRAATEAAEWCAGQLAISALEASRSALAEAELRALRAQISPHFIYNALTAIASFISTDPPRARELVLEFADFTRYSFRRQGEFTTLADELGSIRSYLELEQARFGDRLRVRLQIAPETLTAVIPFLSVQPLVENAVRHGLEKGERGGTVRISSADDGTHTEITVEDDGAGADPESLARLLGDTAPMQHVGLRNVDTRLRQLYGDGSGLVVETNVGAGTLVRMRIPRSQPLHEVERVETREDADRTNGGGGAR
ncbi:histidine kinase [Leucobacter weissii]|uniref:Histidine kinase n=1 Tax=Leucobacter weissii TaxID=1983706 RepID=A0A939S6H9_9MICO|nr:histidine kinase [Leucobacter weissii]MBO1902394.1 histidine kinase [Leucobacter weissii]